MFFPIYQFYKSYTVAFDQPQVCNKTIHSREALRLQNLQGGIIKGALPRLKEVGIKNDTPFYRGGHQKRHFSFYRGGHQNGISIFAQVGLKNCIKFYRGGHQNGISIFAQVGIENCLQFLQRWASKTSFHFYRGGNPKRHSIFTEVIIIKNRAICEGRQGSLQNDL